LRSWDPSVHAGSSCGVTVVPVAPSTPAQLKRLVL
jgi:hypothetical protein